MKTTLFIAALIGAGLFAGQGIAGEMTYDKGTGIWESRECPRPTPPQIDTSDTKALNRSASSYAVYVDQVNVYTTCLAREAEHDVSAISDIILGTVRTEQGDIIGEANGLRDQLYTPQQ